MENYYPPYKKEYDDYMSKGFRLYFFESMLHEIFCEEEFQLSLKNSKKITCQHLID